MEQILSAILLPIVIAGLGAALAAAINSPPVQLWLSANAAKLGSEAAMYASNTADSNHNMLGLMVRCAMAYAETHEKEILTQYQSKAAYVISKVSADPRFPGLNQPLDAISNILEDVFMAYFKACDDPTHDHG